MRDACWPRVHNRSRKITTERAESSGRSAVLRARNAFSLVRGRDRFNNLFKIISRVRCLQLSPTSRSTTRNAADNRKTFVGHRKSADGDRRMRGRIARGFRPGKGKQRDSALPPRCCLRNDRRTIFQKSSRLLSACVRAKSYVKIKCALFERSLLRSNVSRLRRATGARMMHGHGASHCIPRDRSFAHRESTRDIIPFGDEFQRYLANVATEES